MNVSGSSTTGSSPAVDVSTRSISVPLGTPPSNGVVIASTSSGTQLAVRPVGTLVSLEPMNVANAVWGSTCQRQRSVFVAPQSGLSGSTEFAYNHKLPAASNVMPPSVANTFGSGPTSVSTPVLTSIVTSCALTSRPSKGSFVYAYNVPSGANVNPSAQTTSVLSSLIWVIAPVLRSIE